ncbi:spore germination protein (amino acid permease) [Marininema mesophilum]|uniref:Spore germination protein (Amino acid permease) n=1 Tax=Marininema mesophilum TaxID=1048340 RepID=A0A1H2Q4P2_9BACL|nr:endospore germination permease [Marininema mesophilum]SDW02132.1 spore germination protein (amino acid permease) [Marininema mesophilum]
MGKNNHDDTITDYQVYNLLFSCIVGIQVLVLPREGAEVGGIDSIWIVFISGALVFGLVWVIGALMQKIPRQNVIQFTESVLGNKKRRWMGKFLALPFTLVLGGLWLWISSTVTRGFAEVLDAYVLPDTPQLVLMATIVAVSAVAVSNKLVIIARITEFLTPFVYLAIPLFLGAFANGDLLNLLPMFQCDWKDVLKGVLITMCSFSGYSVLFVYMAFFQQPEKSTRTHGVAILVATLFFWLTVVSSIDAFGAWEVDHLVYPTIEDVKGVFVPGEILDRFDALFIVMWMINIFTTIIVIFGAAVELAMTYLQLKEKRRIWVAIIYGFIVCFLAQYPANIYKLWKWSRWASITEMIVILLVVGIFFILLAVRGRRKEEEHASSPS